MLGVIIIEGLPAAQVEFFLAWIPAQHLLPMVDGQGPAPVQRQIHRVQGESQI